MADCFFKKSAGGILLPADDETVDYLTSVKTDEFVKVKISKLRNYNFHKKAFGFFNFCFDHWAADLVNPYMDEKAQKNAFRKQLTILAGYRNEFFNLRTKTIGYEAKSLSYESMDDETFKSYYVALTNAAMANIFQDSDERTYNQLIGFF